MAIKYPHTLTIIRPTLGTDGDWTFPAGTSTRGALFRRRRRTVVGGQGEDVIVTAQAWVPSGTDVQLNDRVVRGTDRFLVVNFVKAENDRAEVDHIGLELGDADA